MSVRKKKHEVAGRSTLKNKI